MQERTEIDGNTYRQFLEGKSIDELRKRQFTAYREAMANPKTHSVFQRKVSRNELCPCGSGAKFKKCCISKSNKGEERILTA